MQQNTQAFVLQILSLLLHDIDNLNNDNNAHQGYQCHLFIYQPSTEGDLEGSFWKRALSVKDPQKMELTPHGSNKNKSIHKGSLHAIVGRINLPNKSHRGTALREYQSHEDVSNSRNKEIKK